MTMMISEVRDVIALAKLDRNLYRAAASRPGSIEAEGRRQGASKAPTNSLDTDLELLFVVRVFWFGLEGTWWRIRSQTQSF